MKAWAFTQRGQPLSVLKLTEIPTPDKSKLQPDELLIQVSHASLNMFSSILTWAVPMLFRTNPSVPEIDFSGRVVAKGTAINSLSISEDVFGTIRAGHHIKAGRGTLAEYVVVHEDEVVRKPANISFAEASGLGAVGVTAYVVVSKSGLKTGDRVLINGGSGGAGVTLLQAARQLIGPSGIIVTTCSAKNFDLVKQFGADEVIDYTALTTSLPAHVSKLYSSQQFDAIIDAVGTTNDLYNSSPAYLKPGKRYLTIGTPMSEGLSVGNVLRNLSINVQNNLWPTWLGGVPRSWQFVDSAEGIKEMLGVIRDAVEEGKFRGQVDSVYEMEDARQAIEKLNGRRVRGKVVVKIQDL